MSEMHEVYTCPHCKQEAEVVDGFVTCHTDGCLIAEDRMSVEEWDDHAAFVWMSEKADALATRLAALSQQHAADERALAVTWKPVGVEPFGDELPFNGQKVLVMHGDEMKIAYYHTWTNEYGVGVCAFFEDEDDTPDAFTEFVGVTHWMPLPEPPTDAK